jgi:hypothetical protein
MTNGHLWASYARWAAKSLYLFALLLRLAVKGEVTKSINPNQLPKGICGNEGAALYTVRDISILIWLC